METGKVFEIMGSKNLSKALAVLAVSFVKSDAVFYDCKDFIFTENAG